MCVIYVKRPAFYDGAFHFSNFLGNGEGDETIFPLMWKTQKNV